MNWRSLKGISLILTLALNMGGTASAQKITHTKESIDEIKVKIESKKAILVDVREQAEWDRGHIKGAVHIPLSQLLGWDREGLSEAEKTKLGKQIPKGSVVYCHCAAGARALPGGESLRKLGYDARPLKPGFRALIEAGFPRADGK